MAGVVVAVAVVAVFSAGTRLVCGVSSGGAADFGDGGRGAVGGDARC